MSTEVGLEHIDRAHRDLELLEIRRHLDILFLENRRGGEGECELVPVVDLDAGGEHLASVAEQDDEAVVNGIGGALGADQPEEAD